jgi:peptide/nickel transport system ATP-binding protein
VSAALSAAGLSVGYLTHGETRRVVGDVDIRLEPNRIVGLAGESGCGKSTLALALAGFRAPGAVVMGGSVDFDGRRISEASVKELRRIWGARIAYLPQDTSTALNPALRIGKQLAEPLRIHRGLSRAAARTRAVELLTQVDIPGPEQALDRYPHQFSGGQQQRIALALGLACGPEVLILDEPTTGLDVTTQARMNRLILALARETGTATLYVSHNLALLATVCDDLAIMYGGQVVEWVPARDVYLHARHPYTAALIASVPSIHGDRRPAGIAGLPPPVVVDERCGFADRCAFRAEKCMEPIPLRSIGGGRLARCVRVEELALDGAAGTAGTLHEVRLATGGEAPLLEVRDLRCVFRQRRHEVVAVDGVSLGVASGRTLGIAGESGSGKSTLLRALAGLLRPAAGEMFFRGQPLLPSASARRPAVRRAIQIVFQNPDATLNPRHTVYQAIERPLKLFRSDVPARERRAFAADVLRSMRLNPHILDRYPRHLSGGQRQRVALARALVAEPEVILCDEVTSALDVSVQATILELLIELRDRRNMSLVFVTHDLGVLRAIADDAVVMERGSIREEGPIAEVLTRPRDDYTRRLLESVPDPQRARDFLGGLAPAST